MKVILKLVLLCVLLTKVADLDAQSSIVTGTVTSSSGEPLPGVTVFLKGTATATATDAYGKYTMDAKGETLVFTFVGLKSQEVAVDGRTSIDVVMQEDVQALDEIVVVGYGTQQKKDITGAIGIVSAKAFESRPNTQFGNLIQGKVAGVQVISPSGKPSQGFSMRIRGTGSINGNSEPLYVVDGTISADTRSLNPGDIENITILKDASSTAIYGALGANGVVLITTKKGTSATPKIDFSAYSGFSSVWKKIKVLNSEQYRDLMTEMGQSTDWSKYTQNTDWQNEIFQNGRSQNYQVALSGKNNGTAYYISGAWTEQIGAVRSSEMQRTSFKINLEHKVSNKLTVGTNLSYIRYNDVDVADNLSVNSGGIILGVLSTPQNIGVYNANGTFTSNPLQNWENPYSTTDGSQRGYSNQRLLGNAYAELSLLRDLKFKSNIGVDYQAGIYDYFLDPFRTTFGRANMGIGRNNTDTRNYYTTDNTLTYKKDINDHHITALVGWVTQNFKWENSSIQRTGYSGSSVTTTNAGSVITSASNDKSEKSTTAFISRINYDYADKYLLTANFRNDGSSSFGPNKRFGKFPSISVGWRISNESFFENVNAIDDLKIRAGWGVSGNDLRPYAYLGEVSPGANYPINGVILPGNYPSSIQNNDLKWETTEQTNVGLDISFANSRIDISADAYIKNTSGVLLDVPLPRSTGFNSGTQNAGKIQNKGIELQITTHNVHTDNVQWTTDFNITFNRNKVIYILGTQLTAGDIPSRGQVSYSIEDKPLGLFYGYVSGGVDPQTGDIYYLSQEGNSTFTPTADDIRIIGNPNPDFIYGMTNSISYKNLSLNIFLQGSQGNDVFNATRVETEGMSDPKNQSAVVVNRWRNPGDVTDIPKSSWASTNNSRISTRFVENGSYLRVKALTLSYNLPSTLLSKVKIKNLKIYATGENLFTFTKYSGFDPEVTAIFNGIMAPGVDFGTYPQVRNLIFGLNLTF